MTRSAMPDDSPLALAPLEEKADHVRGSPAGRLIREYGDYECPYSRQAFHAIELVEQQLAGNVRFAFRHFPLTAIHPHALAAAAAAEAAARQGRFWDMHGLMFHPQKALEDGDLRGYPAQLGLDVAAFDRDRASASVLERIQRDIDSGLARPFQGPGTLTLGQHYVRWITAPTLSLRGRTVCQPGTSQPSRSAWPLAPPGSSWTMRVPPSTASRTPGTECRLRPGPQPPREPVPEVGSAVSPLLRA